MQIFNLHKIRYGVTRHPLKIYRQEDVAYLTNKVRNDERNE